MRMRDHSCASVPSESAITGGYTGSNPRLAWQDRYATCLLFFLIASHARCALIVPKRRGSRGVTRCASRSRLRLSIKGSDRGGRKKKHGRFISDGRQLSRTPQSGACVYFFFPLYFFLRVVKLQYTGCCRLLKDPFRLV